MSPHSEVSLFTQLPFSESLQQDLVTAGYVSPTPIQARCLGPALEGRDLIGLAQTGTGKTAAYALPIIHRLAPRADLAALILAPTRELAQQIVGVFQKLGRTSGVRVASVVGGVKIEKDWKALRSWPNVLVATPGRLIDHLEQKTVSLGEIEMLVVDEADRMHDMGFIPQIRRIIAALPANRQTMMFTATMPADVEQVARRHMRDPIRIQVGTTRPVERAAQSLYRVQDDDKVALLQRLLDQEEGRILIFVRTKRGVDRLTRRVSGRHTVARLHGDREQSARDEAMGGFREGRYRVLIATDIAARGLDVADIEHVINYDFPRSAEDYIHRIGRTARLAAKGKATSFVTPADKKYVQALERLIGEKITLTTPDGRAVAETEAEPHVAKKTGGGRPARAASGSGRHGGRDNAAGRTGAHGASGGRHAAHGHRHTPVPVAAAEENKPAVAPAAAAPVGVAATGGDGPQAPGEKRRRRRRGGRGRHRGGAGAVAGAPDTGAGQTPHPHVAHVEGAKEHGRHAAAKAEVAPGHVYAAKHADQSHGPVAAYGEPVHGAYGPDAPHDEPHAHGDAATAPDPGQGGGKRRRRRRGKGGAGATPAAQPEGAAQAHAQPQEEPQPHSQPLSVAYDIPDGETAHVIEWD